MGYVLPTPLVKQFPNRNWMTDDDAKQVNVTGAFGWAAYDNFEWFEGSHVKFGVQYLNQTSLERFPKASFFQFLDWFKERGGATLGKGSAGGNASAIPNA
jgi:hypothetical protein